MLLQSLIIGLKCLGIAAHYPNCNCLCSLGPGHFPAGTDIMLVTFSDTWQANPSELAAQPHTAGFADAPIHPP